MTKDGRQTQDRRKVFIMTAVLSTDSDTPLSYDCLMIDSEEAALRERTERVHSWYGTVTDGT
jgi:hypothetical protein